MSLPSDTDYNAAIQNPSRCFVDTELRQGVVELMSASLPIPKARSGNFATVYKVGGRHAAWAVRCFTRAVQQDQHRRYEEISKSLRGAGLPCFVAFDYLEKGIEVGRTWYPIVKMEWVQGENLDSYIARNLTSHAALLKLARDWAELASALRRAGVAHGDLQHGNVLVANGALKLVDYDGMFVPALTGLDSYECGHRNYQHPKRTSGQFGPTLDYFSEWVVFVSLLALAAEPTLWARLKGGDDCLLLRRSDFERPYQSRALLELSTLRDPSARTAAALFKSLVELPPDQIPFLNADILPEAVGSVPARSGALPAWVVENTPKVARVEAGTGAGLGAASWVLDHLEKESVPLRLDLSVVWERLAVILTAALCGVLIVAAPGLSRFAWAGISGVAALTNLLALWGRYRRTSAFARWKDAAHELNSAVGTFREAQRVVEKAEKQLQSVESEWAGEAARFASASEALDRAKQSEFATIEARFQAGLDDAARRRQDLDAQEQAERRHINQSIGVQVTAARERLAKNTRLSAEALSSELRIVQNNFVTQALRSTPLTATTSGVGSHYVNTLRQAGVLSAFDCEPYRVINVYGVGPKTAARVRRWRDNVVASAQRQAPLSLPQAVEAQIRARFAYEDSQASAEVKRLSAVQAQREEYVKTVVDSGHRDIEGMLARLEQEKIVSQRQCADKYEKDSFSQNAERVLAKSAYTTKAGQAEEVLAAARRARFAVEWKHQRALREAERAKSLRFSSYVLKVCGRTG